MGRENIMATIKDIAEYAGVSHGTVSNVLNKRGNVSVEKINLVEQAAYELGYSMNAQAKQLRQGHSRQICVVVPQGNIKRHMDLFSGINIEARKVEYEVNIYFTEDYNYEERRLLEHIITQKPSAVVLVSTFEKSTNIFNCDIPFIFVERELKNLPDNAVYVGFDYYAAGNALAQKCVDEGMKNVAVYSESERFSNGKRFLEGVRDVFESVNINHSCFQSLDILKLNSAFALQETEENYDAIITDCIERVELIKAVRKYSGSDSVPNMYTLDNKCVQLDDSINRYELNYKLCGKQIGKYILECEKSGKVDKEILRIKNDGFQIEGDLKYFEKKIKLNFLSLSSPTMRALKYLLPDFEKKTGIEVNLVEVTYDELNKTISMMNKKESSPYDLIRLDMVWLPLYADKLFKPLEFDKEPYLSIKNNFSKVFKDEYFKANNISYVFPFDPSVQILYYRRDLFENALIRRDYYEKNKRQLCIPRNYKEYDEVARFFTKKFNPDSPTKYGAVLVYGATAVAACDFLPRWREKGKKLLDEKEKINVNTLEMKEALEAYVDAVNYSDKTMLQWWNQSMELFAEGATAMNIVFSNHAPMMLLNNHSDIIRKVGFSAVPGKKPLLGGGVVGISKHTEKTEACEMFFRWLYSEKIASTITLLGGYVNHKNLIYNQDILQVYPWVAEMERAFAIGERKRLKKDNDTIDEALFEGVVGEGVRSAVLGVQSIDEILDKMQKECVELKNK